MVFRIILTNDTKTMSTTSANSEYFFYIFVIRKQHIYMTIFDQEKEQQLPGKIDTKYR